MISYVKECSYFFLYAYGCILWKVELCTLFIESVELCLLVNSCELWALDLQLWPGSLVGYLLGSSTDGHRPTCRQVCRLAAWIS